MHVPTGKPANCTPAWHIAPDGAPLSIDKASSYLLRSANASRLHTCWQKLPSLSYDPQRTLLRIYRRLVGTASAFWELFQVNSALRSTKQTVSQTISSECPRTEGGVTYCTLLSLSSSFLSHSKSLYRRRTEDSFCLKTGRFVWKNNYLKVIHFPVRISRLMSVIHNLISSPAFELHNPYSAS